MATHTLALAGAAGGAGTTRLALEFGATIARTGRDVLVLDAAYDTQGLADHVQGPIETDLTAVVTGDASLEAATYQLPLDVPGTLALCPARGPFDRIARAKTADAGAALGRHVATAALSTDVVILDVPPVGGNQALAALDAADRCAVVTPDTPRGSDALARTRERFADLGFTIDAVVSNRADEEYLGDADAHVPTASARDAGDCPSCVPPDETVAPAVAAAVEASLGVTLDLEFPEGGRIAGLVGR